jgi:hypothetical protein
LSCEPIIGFHLGHVPILSLLNPRPHRVLARGFLFYPRREMLREPIRQCTISSSRFLGASSDNVLSSAPRDDPTLHGQNVSCKYLLIRESACSQTSNAKDLVDESTAAVRPTQRSLRVSLRTHCAVEHCKHTLRVHSVFPHSVYNLDITIVELIGTVRLECLMFHLLVNLLKTTANVSSTLPQTVSSP